MALPDPDTLMTRRQLAAALTEAGYPTAETTLSTKATRGNGPPYFKYGPNTVYRWGPALKWASDRLLPARSTSDSDAQTAQSATNGRGCPVATNSANSVTAGNRTLLPDQTHRTQGRASTTHPEDAKLTEKQNTTPTADTVEQQPVAWRLAWEFTENVLVAIPRRSKRPPQRALSRRATNLNSKSNH
jgi:hypothetical protein